MSIYTIDTARYIVPIEIAKNWVKMTQEMQSNILPIVLPRDIIFAGKGHILHAEGMAIAKLNAVFKSNPALKATSLPLTISYVTRANGGVYPYSRCQLTGNIMALDKLKYRRIYNKKLFCKSPSNLGMVWLIDKTQWVYSNDIRLGIIKYVGNKINYCSDAIWMADNVSTEWSEYENCLVDKDESSRVIFNMAQPALRISQYEIAKQRLGIYCPCNTCGRWYSQVETLINNDRVCTACVENRPRGTTRMSNIYPYSHKVESDLGYDDTNCTRIGTSKDGSGKLGIPIYLGVELEYNIPEDKRSDSAGNINNMKYARCKSDGTVQGYEIVSKPCSIETHRTNITTILNKHGAIFDAGNNCGVHVHISRKDKHGNTVFTNTEIGKVLGFIHREHNRDFILAMARRESHKYARFSDSFIKEHKRNPEAMMQTANFHPNSPYAASNGKVLAHHDTTLQSKVRYTALNVKDKTLEFRIFAATKDINEVMACIEFCEALFIYAHEHTVANGKVAHLSIAQWLKVENFIDFVSKYKYKVENADAKAHSVYKLKYPSLMEYITAKQLFLSSKSQDEVWEIKLNKSFDERIRKTDKHREVPKIVKEHFIGELKKSPFDMTKWLNDKGAYITRLDTKWILYCGLKTFKTYEVIAEKEAA